MGRRVMAVLVAMLVGFVGVIAVMLYAKGADSRAVADQRPQTVYIAQELVPSGTTAATAVAKGLMVPTKVAAKGLPVGALAKVDAVNGKLMALTDIAAGEFVVASRFGRTPTGEKAIQVPDGQVAISIMLPDPSRVGTFVTPGSRIVIFDSYPQNAPAKTQILLDDVLVIGVGQTSLTPVANANGETQTEGKAQASAASALVTVAVPPDAAVRLVHGIQTGILYAALRGTDTKANLGQIISDSNVFTK